MSPSRRTLAVPAFVVVTAVVLASVYLLAAAGASLLVRAGTVFQSTEIDTWMLRVTGPAPGGRLVGAWDARNASGAEMPVSLAVANGTLTQHPPLPMCPRRPPPAVVNNSVDAVLGSGPYTLFWMSCFGVTRITITEDIELAP